MKILLMSDNHGRWPKVHELVEYYRPQVDLILHCVTQSLPLMIPSGKK